MPMWTWPARNENELHGSFERFFFFLASFCLEIFCLDGFLFVCFLVFIFYFGGSFYYVLFFERQRT